MIAAQAANPTFCAGKSSEDVAGSKESRCGCESSEFCVSHCAGYGAVCPSHARAAGRSACKRIGEILDDSKLFADGEPKFHKIPQSDVDISDVVLGEGGFSKVNACAFKDDPNSQALAIKYLKRRIMVERQTFEYGASDLANEAFFLAKLRHPNIVKLHAVTEGSLEENFAAGKDGGYFIIIDRLVETLDQRIDSWQKEKAEDCQARSPFHRLSREFKEKQRSLLKQRLHVAFEIAKVMEYLHSNKVIFRDLKPDNIGFDHNDTLKLFDFGLAKEEKPRDAVEGGKYKMSGQTGSRRYMAPEGK